MIQRRNVIGEVWNKRIHCSYSGRVAINTVLSRVVTPVLCKQSLITSPLPSVKDIYITGDDGFMHYCEYVCTTLQPFA